MTGSMACTPERETGFRLDQLAAAFDRVRNLRDWKAPIEAVIPAADRAVVEQAIRWFTGTEAEFRSDGLGSGRLVVVALGYRLGQAADAAAAPRPAVALTAWRASAKREWRDANSIAAPSGDGWSR
jgi:hypothetical protein